MACRYFDLAYMLIISTQLFGMLVLDLAPFYPLFLSNPLLTVRELYVSLSGDPFFTRQSHEPWFQAFLYIEGLVQLPLALYLVYKLASQKVTSGETESAGLAFGCVTGMGSVTCCFHLWQLGEGVVSTEKKAMLFWGTYLPFAVVPIVMAVDMHHRLLARINGMEAKTKKL